MGDIKSNSSKIFDILQHRGIIKITGEDAEKFLQSLITNDIYSSSTIYAMMLSPQGRYLFDFFISNLDDEFLIDVNKTYIAALISRLKLYKLRARVEIEDLSETHCVYYSLHSLSIDKLIEYHDPRYSKLGLRTIALMHEKEISSSDLYLHDKYRFAIPDGETDLISDKSMPQEYGADYLHCIDYHKGCYVGQEVISRTKYQGVIRKQIFKILGSDLLTRFEQGEEIIAGGNKVGVLASAYKNLGIGLIRLEDYEKHKTNKLYIGDVEVKLEVPEWIAAGSI